MNPFEGGRGASNGVGSPRSSSTLLLLLEQDKTSYSTTPPLSLPLPPYSLVVVVFSRALIKPRSPRSLSLPLLTSNYLQTCLDLCVHSLATSSAIAQGLRSESRKRRSRVELRLRFAQRGEEGQQENVGEERRTTLAEHPVPLEPVLTLSRFFSRFRFPTLPLPATLPSFLPLERTGRSAANSSS